MTKVFNKDLWIRDAIAKGYLQVHEDGRIYRCWRADKRGALLSDRFDLVVFRTHKKSGRVYFTMTWRGFTKSVLVNRVIALKFLPNPENKPQVNHIDGDKSHNYLYQPTPELEARWGRYQLEWATAGENEQHAHGTGLKTGRGSSNSRAKLNAEQALAIRNSPDPIPELMQRYGIGRSTVVNIQSGRTWSHL